MRTKIKPVKFDDEVINLITEKKYYIRTLYSDWVEVNKSQYESYKKNLESSIVVKKNTKEILKRHLKIVEVLK